MADNISLADELRRLQQAGSETTAANNRQARDWRARNGEEDADKPDAIAEAEEPEVNTAAFGFFRGVRDRAIFLEFQRLKGSWLGAGYAWLPCPTWDPTGGGKGRGQAIILEYATGLKVTIRGRNLRRCYERILRQQVFRISEMGEGADSYLPEDAAVVYAIEVVEPVVG